MNAPNGPGSAEPHTSFHTHAVETMRFGSGPNAGATVTNDPANRPKASTCATDKPRYCKIT